MKQQYLNTDYIIYDDGRCFSNKTNRFLKPSSEKYPSYNLTYPNGKTKKTKIHRMVAETFLPKPEGKDIVNHKDGNTKNYCINNLEWCDYSENCAHAASMKLRPRSNQIPVYKEHDLPNESWKQIQEYPNYSISNKGRVLNNNTNRLLKPAKSNCGGYLEVSLWKNNKGQTKRIHVLVYSIFSEDYDLKGYVINHKDGNKLNNNVENLEKITYTENLNHAFYVIKTNKRAKAIQQLDFKTGEVMAEFTSISEATRKLNINNISRAIKNSTTAGGYKWKFKD